MDFLEVPSQALENWVYQPAVLARLGAHHVTGDPLPEDTVTALVAARHVAPGIRYTRQIAISAIDLIMHSGGPPFVYPPWGIAAHSVEDLVAQVYAHLGLPPPLPSTNFVASLFHFTSYSATYHSYLVSEVASADCFTLFAHNPLDQAQGSRFRELILAPGATVDATAMLAAFLARPVSVDAFFDSVGFTSSDSG